MKRILTHARFLKIALGTLITMAVLLCILYAVIISGAPKLDQYDAAPKGYRSTILDQNGTVIQTLSKESSNRVYVSENEIPDTVKQAFIAIEDERFYKHRGVDRTGILRAFFKGLKNREFSEGASTITQQLIKNNVLTDWTSEDSFKDRLVRKIREQHLAKQLERKQDKEWILNNYLNTINLGNGTWGVQAASRSYFGKDVSELTASEAAVLAAIPKSPTDYNPVKNEDANKTRRELVLSKMLSLGYLTQAEYEEAKKDDVYDRIANQSNESQEGEVLSWFEDALVYQVEKNLESKLSLSSDAAWDLLYTGGLTIESTADSTMQEACEKAVASHTKNDDTQTSLVLLDVKTGEVRGLVGGSGEKTASLVYNHATDSIRQPGSTLKIIGEYAAGLEAGSITLGTAIDDAPHTYTDGTSLKNSDGTYGGMTTIRQAIAASNNIVAVKCLQQEGIEAVLSTIEGFGISTLDEADRVESLALGGTANGVTNLELTSAYGTIARGGNYTTPVFYTRILDKDGNVLLTSSQETHTSIRSTTASLLTDAMRDVISEGTGVDTAIDGLDLAGKSGTTTDAKDAWFVGYSSELVCGVWGGYDDNQAQDDTSYVKAIWKDAMSGSHVNLTTSSLSASQAQDLVSVKICTKCGKLAEEGLCDHTVQGDMTATEYYVSGTEPTVTCDCHVKVSEGGGGFFSVSSGYKVYLRSATPGTADAAYVAPSDAQEYKEHWYDGLFDRKNNSQDENDYPDSGYDSRNKNGDSDSQYGSQDKNDDSDSGYGSQDKDKQQNSSRDSFWDYWWNGTGQSEEKESQNNTNENRTQDNEEGYSENDWSRSEGSSWFGGF